MTERDMTGPLLNRSAWLEAHGFAIDPFSAEAFQAETDPLFEHPGLPAFVDPPNYEEIRGRPDHPGFRYIFAPNGAGKSSLRRRMRVDFDASLAHNLSNAPRVLAVEYTDHGYASDQASAHDHVARIFALLANRLAIWYPGLDFCLPTTGSAHDLLSRAVQMCRSARLDGVCILVDNIRDQGGDLESAFNRVAALASQPELLNIPGVLFKFMFPNAIFETAARVLPLERFLFHRIEWDGDSLREVLNQRLLACMDASLRDSTILPFRALCNEMLQQIIEERLVNYGLKLKHPRAMWRLGYFLIEEHFNQFPEHRCTADRVIVPDALERAMRQAEAFEAAIAPRPSPKGKEDTTRDQLMRIRAMVENGDLEEAIDEFQKTEPSLARRMKSRYARTTKDRRKGTITLDEYRAQIFDLTDWLLQELEERLGGT